MNILEDLSLKIAYIPDEKRKAHSDIFPFSLPFLVQVVLSIKSLLLIGL